jgi:hypothetical protein
MTYYALWVTLHYGCDFVITYLFRIEGIWTGIEGIRDRWIVYHYGHHLNGG